jgi:cobalt-zinc-cadmium efflux system outer membrane protein
MGFFLSAPLPVWNRNQGEIERAKREEVQLQARIRALRAQIESEVQTAYDQYLSAQKLVERIGTDMLAQARDVRGITEYSYRRGEASFLEFLDAQRAYNDTVQSYNDARADYARSLFLLESVSAKGVQP